MLSYIKLENFKSFKSIKFDLRGCGKKPKKFAFIYGENGSGKSNLIAAFMFLRDTIDTFINQERLNKINLERFNNIANSFDIEMKDQIFEKIIKGSFFTLKNLIEDHERIGGNKAHMRIEIGFYINSKEGVYVLEFDRNSVIFEELKYLINDRVGILYSISNKNIVLSPSVFIDNDYMKEANININKYWGNHTFLAILNHEMKSKNKNFLEKAINKNLLKAYQWLSSYCVSHRSGKGEIYKITTPFKVPEVSGRGRIKQKEKKHIELFEKILNMFFTQLYPDVKRVYYEFDNAKDGFEEYRLFFDKLMNGKIVKIPFHLESTGTQKLLEIFPLMFSATFGMSVFADEVDSGVHDVLAKDIINSFINSLKSVSSGQFIATTHNTYIMQNIPPKYIYILDSDANGDKEIFSIDEFSVRTQANNNIQLKYLRGDYGGIPLAGYLNFKDMVNEVKDIKKNENA